DAVIMSAAVADYTPEYGAGQQKIEKGGPVSLSLVRTADILRELGAARGESSRPVLVRFAAETHDVLPPPRAKPHPNPPDLIVANDVSECDAGFDVDTNRVTLVSRDDTQALPLMSKARVASAILDRLERLLASEPVSAPVGAR